MLPDVGHDEFWSTWHRDKTEWWDEPLRRIAGDHGFDPGGGVRAGAGRNIVLYAGDVVVKLVPPFWSHMWEREVRALSEIAPKLSVQTPELVASGPIGSWRYLVMERVEGASLGWRAEDATPSERVELITLQGWLAREISHLPPLPALRWEWAEVLGEDRSTLRRRLDGLAPHLVDTAEDYVDHAGDLGAGDVTLHGDLASVNFLRTPGGDWALVDWSDAGTGPFDHEFISPFMHQFRGRAADLALFWDAYGEFSQPEVTRHRIAARAVLKYAALLPSLLADLPTVADWEAFARHFTGLAS